MNDLFVTRFVRLAPFLALAVAAAACSSAKTEPDTKGTDSGVQGSTPTDGGLGSSDGAVAPQLDAAAVACEPISSTTHTEVCSQCIQTKCAPTCAICANDNTCLQIWDCVNGSGDFADAGCVDDAGVTSTACGNACGVKFITDINAINEFSAFIEGVDGNPLGCVATNCPTECPSGP